MKIYNILHVDGITWVKCNVIISNDEITGQYKINGTWYSFTIPVSNRYQYQAL